MTFIGALGSLAGVTAQLGVFFVGAWLALSGRGITPGVLIVFITLTAYVITPISEFPEQLAAMKAGLALTGKLSAALSAKRLETGGAIARVMAEQEERRAELTKLKRELLQLKAAALRPTEGSICIFESDIDMITLRELVNAGSELAGKVCAGFAGTDGDYKYIIGSRTVPLRARAKEINAAIDGRGGGSDAMIQGTSRARREDIERYFNALK